MVDNMTFLRRRRKDDVMPTPTSGGVSISNGGVSKKKWSPSKSLPQTVRKERSPLEKKAFVRKS
jgi:hypothetical protein